MLHFIPLCFPKKKFLTKSYAFCKLPLSSCSLASLHLSSRHFYFVVLIFLLIEFVIFSFFFPFSMLLFYFCLCSIMLTISLVVHSFFAFPFEDPNFLFGCLLHTIFNYSLFKFPVIIINLFFVIIYLSNG